MATIFLKRKITSVERIWRNWNPHALFVQILNDTAIVENSMAVSQKVKNRITKESPIFTSGYISKRIKSSIFKRHLYSTFIAAIFIIVKMWK